MKYHVNPQAIDCPLGDGLAIFKADSGTCFNLNHSGALLWAAARQPTGVDELCERLAGAYGGRAADYVSDVRTLVDALVANGLLLELSDENGAVQAV